jgi:hypothetical protein
MTDNLSQLKNVRSLAAISLIAISEAYRSDLEPRKQYYQTAPAEDIKTHVSQS